MRRRTVFKHLAAATAAAWILPSCVSDPKKVSVALNHLQVTGDEEALLGDIADVIIPATETPGARAVEAHLFTFIMVDDCLAPEEQEKYLKGLRSFPDVLRSLTGKSFSSASAEERLQMLISLEERQDELSEEIKMFYSKTRSYIVQGYLSSKHFLTDVKPYQLVPGPDYKGCIPVDSTTLS
jgi:hypothetical protein